MAPSSSASASAAAAARSAALAQIAAVAALACAAVLAVSVRLFSVVKYESVIHEFDPYFNFRKGSLLFFFSLIAMRCVFVLLWGRERGERGAERRRVRGGRAPLEFSLSFNRSRNAPFASLFSLSLLASPLHSFSLFCVLRGRSSKTLDVTISKSGLESTQKVGRTRARNPSNSNQNDLMLDRSSKKNSKNSISLLRRDQVPLQDVALPPLGLVRRPDVVPSGPRGRRHGVPGKEEEERLRERRKKRRRGEEKREEEEKKKTKEDGSTNLQPSIAHLSPSP